ncbi:MAG: ATP synthase F0 subunit B [Acidobacteriota bacterium]
MEQTLQALAGILTKAIPTIIILVILHQFLKAVLFGPVEKMLKQRGEMTHGARHSADQSLKNAERKTAEYEAKLRDAKSVVYKEQEETRKQWLTDQTEQVARAKSDADVRVAAAKKEIATEVVTARATLEQTTQALADQIATTVLMRRAG